MQATQIHRGQLLHFLADPTTSPDAIGYHKDGVLVVSEGHIHSIGDAAELLPKFDSSVPVLHHRNALLVPGFVDCHVHYPQYNIIAAYGTQLLDWLNTHTFPEEQKFGDAVYARKIAELFLDELLSNGTTTALVFGTVHKESVDAFFEAASARHLRMICGKVMMDRNAPAALCDTAESSVIESETLINRWHGKDRLGYAITPRFAPTSTKEQLTGAAELHQRHPGTMIHTHLAENVDECAWVKELYPEFRSYVDVYQQCGLMGRRSVFAHAIHLDDDDWQAMQNTDSVIAHCPTSNLFIGSGLFDLKTAQQYNVRVGFGTDIGGGDSFSILRTINEAYKVQRLRGNSLDPMRSLYMATLGGAKSLSLDSHIGNFTTGKEADFNVLDLNATNLISRRIDGCETLAEKLFVMQMLGDDRSIRQTWIMGEPAFRRGV